MEGSQYKWSVSTEFFAVRFKFDVDGDSLTYHKQNQVQNC